MRTTKQTEGSVLLSEDRIYFGGMNLTYRLSVCTGRSLHRYRIEVQKEDEFAAAEVGNDLERALSCYRSIVRGIVTPCTLEEVVRELQYA